MQESDLSAIFTSNFDETANSSNISINVHIRATLLAYITASVQVTSLCQSCGNTWVQMWTEFQMSIMDDLIELRCKL